MIHARAFRPCLLGDTPHGLGFRPLALALAFSLIPSFKGRERVWETVMFGLDVWRLLVWASAQM